MGAVAFLAANRSETAENLDAEKEEDEEHPGPASKGLPPSAWILCFEAANFVIYAATYTLPSILPFVAGSFHDKAQSCHLLLRMMVFQSIGDVSGRMLAPSAKSHPLHRKA